MQLSCHPLGHLWYYVFFILETDLRVLKKNVSNLMFLEPRKVYKLEKLFRNSPGSFSIEKLN